MSFIYLATPYSHTNPQVRETRYMLAAEAVHYYMLRQRVVFSPIVHCHEVAKIWNLPPEFDFWMFLDKQMIRSADSVHVIKFSGWEESRGVTAEIAFTRGLKKPLLFIEPEEIGIFGAYREPA